MTTLMIYLWTMADKVVFLSLLTAIIGLTIYVIFWFVVEFWNDVTTEGKKEEKKRFETVVNKMPVKTLLFLLAIGIFVPSKKDLAIIYVVPKIIESKIVKEDLPELYSKGVEALKRELDNIGVKKGGKK